MSSTRQVVPSLRTGTGQKRAWLAVGTHAAPIEHHNIRTEIDVCTTVQPAGAHGSLLFACLLALEPLYQTLLPLLPCPCLLLSTLDMLAFTPRLLAAAALHPNQFSCSFAMLGGQYVH